MQSLQTEKAHIRAELLSKRKAIPPLEREKYSRAICDGLYSLITQIKPRTVLLYHPVRGEVDVLPLARALLNEGMQIAFPVSIEADTHLKFFAVRSLDALKSGAYGIPEPDNNGAELTDFSDCLCVVPALSIDKHGFRLGYGKGYYDRFLEDKHIFCVCPLYSCMLSERLPHENTDVKIKAICTEKGVIFVEQ